MNLSESWQVLRDCFATDELQECAAADQAGANWFALFGNRPRSLLLPASNRRARNTAVSFFLPDSARNLYAHARIAAHSLLGTSARLPLLSMPPASATELCSQLELTASPELAFLIGTPGPYQKASMLVMSPDGDPLALVKMSLRPRANVMVSAETSWLHVLNGCPSLHRFVPELLRAGKARNGCRYVAQSILNGRPGTRAFTAQHADFLQRLGAVDCYVETYKRTPIRRALHENAAKLLPSLPPRLQTLLQASLDECTTRLSRWRGPFVISHGDFAAWNIRTEDDGIRVFDWEYAAAGMPPLFDLFHFHLIGPASSGRAIKDRDMNHALAPARAFALLTYPDFDWSEGIVRGFGLAYLLHTLLFYGLSRGELLESHSVVRAYCQLIERRKEWLS